MPNPPGVYTHAYERPCTHVKDPVVHVSLVDYGNTKITSMHVYPRRQNVAAQLAEELRTVTYRYATPPLEDAEKNTQKMLAFKKTNQNTQEIKIKSERFLISTRQNNFPCKFVMAQSFV